MKASLWTLAVIALLLGLLAGGSAWMTRTASDAFYQAALEIENSVLQENWSAAAGQRDAFENQWSQAKMNLQMLVHHQDTDDVNLALGRLRAGILLEDAGISLEALAELKESCLHLYHRDALRLVNLI